MANKKRRGRSGARRGAILAIVIFALLFVTSLAMRHRDRLADFSILPRDDDRASTTDRRVSRKASAPETATAESPGLRLQILNATGVNRLALETGDRLRHWDVDTLDRGNAPAWPFPETLLLVRAEKPARQAVVEKLAKRMGGVPVLLQRRGDLVLDATLLLGHDWEDYHWPEP